MPTLNWIGKDKVVNHHHEVPYKPLEHRYRFQADGTAPANSTGNMIIHGDNLEALKSLLPLYEGQVDCIYIDPPYNTGNEGWVYNDNVNDPVINKWIGSVVGKEFDDLTRGDKWLCMIRPRLSLLERLLCDTGVILISIDDASIWDLKKLCDDIFGASRFIGVVVWKSRQNKDNRNTTGLSIDHEYILCYGAKIRGDDRNKEQFKNPDNDERGDWTSGNMVGLASSESRPNLHYDLIDSSTGINYGCPLMGWRYDRRRMSNIIAEGRVLWPKDASGRPREKVFLSDLKSEFTGFSSIINEPIFTRDGTREIEAIFGDRVFEFPKPSDLIKLLLTQGASSRNSIILDSFGGSGTTAHAVLKLNQQDGGNRRFILVEMMDYAETITAERVRRVMNGYGVGDKAVPGLGGGFDFYSVSERPLLDAHGNLDETHPLEIIRRYIAHSENVPAAEYVGPDNPVSPAYLGQGHGVAVFFHYDRDHETVLNLSFLESVRWVGPPPGGGTVIYADYCALPAELTARHGLVFKKIPRDPTRL